LLFTVQVSKTIKSQNSTADGVTVYVMLYGHASAIVYRCAGIAGP